MRMVNFPIMSKLGGLKSGDGGAYLSISTSI